jgi:hypothetical protein
MNEMCDTCDLKTDCPNEVIKQKRLEVLKVLGRGYGFSAKDIIENLSTMFPCENYTGETQ